MTRAEAIEALTNWLEEHKETFYSILEEMDSYDGFLADDRIEDMSSLSDYLYGMDTTAIFELGASARDEYGQRFDSGRPFYRWDSYGNLVSTDSRSSYDDYLTRDNVINILENGLDWYDWAINREEAEELRPIFEAYENFEECEYSPNHQTAPAPAPEHSGDWAE